MNTQPLRFLRPADRTIKGMPDGMRIEGGSVCWHDLRVPIMPIKQLTNPEYVMSHTASQVQKAVKRLMKRIPSNE